MAGSAVEFVDAEPAKPRPPGARRASERDATSVPPTVQAIGPWEARWNVAAPLRAVVASLRSDMPAPVCLFLAAHCQNTRHLGGELQNPRSQTAAAPDAPPLPETYPGEQRRGYREQWGSSPPVARRKRRRRRAGATGTLATPRSHRRYRPRREPPMMPRDSAYRWTATPRYLPSSRPKRSHHVSPRIMRAHGASRRPPSSSTTPVSYTHLTLPTILRV